MTVQYRTLAGILLCVLFAAGFATAVRAQEDGVTVMVDPACVVVRVVVNGDQIVNLEQHCESAPAVPDESDSEATGIVYDERLNPIPDAMFAVYSRSYGYEVLWQEGMNQHQMQLVTAGVPAPEERELLSPEGSTIQVYRLPSGQMDFVGPVMADGKYQEFIYPEAPGGLWRVMEGSCCVCSFHTDVGAGQH